MYELSLPWKLEHPKGRSEVIYLGCTRDLRKRIASYSVNGLKNHRLTEFLRQGQVLVRFCRAQRCRALEKTSLQLPQSSRRVAQSQQRGSLKMKKNSQTDIPELILEYNTSRIVFAEEEEEEEAHVVISLKDITERKQAEDSLRLRNAALEAAANAIVITDREGPNPVGQPGLHDAHRLRGGRSRRQEPAGTGQVRPAAPSFYKGLWDTILAGQVWRGEIINRRKDGSLYTEEMTITPVPG